jgi:WD40 repeat protein
MSRLELPAEVLAACGGSILRLWQRPNFEGATVSHSAGVQYVSWNRNNKVVATGCLDGTIQLCYSHGQAMSVLRSDGGEQLGGLGSLDWSMGSKFLAAGSRNGTVYVWDLKLSKVGGPGAPWPPLRASASPASA